MLEMYSRSTRVLPVPVWKRACEEIERELVGWLTEMTDCERGHWALCPTGFCTMPERDGTLGSMCYEPEFQS